MLTQLMKLGLSEKEAKVYLAALELGTQTAQEIAKKAGVNRATTYVILQTLMQKGLASTFSKGKKTFFAAEPPEQLDHLLRKKEEEIFEHRRDLEAMIPELRALVSRSSGQPKVRFFEGHEGVQSMLEEVYRRLPEDTLVQEFLALDAVRAEFPHYETMSTLKRLKRNISAHVIYTHRHGPQEEMTDRTEKRTARFLSKDRFPFASTVLLIPAINRVVISSYRGGCSGVILENPELCQTMASLFRYIWDSLQESKS